MTVTSKSNLDYALDYARRGWDMAPATVTVRMGKKYMDSHAQWGSEGTHDLDTIHRWFGPDGEAARPEQGIVVVTGKRSGLFVVDVDNAYLWDQITADPEKIVPNTYTVTSRSGGKHLYFKWPEGFEGHGSNHLYPKSLDLYSEKDRLAGIDVKEEGGIVFAPPMRVRDEITGEIDGEYTVVDPAVELAEVPQWILDQYMDVSAKSRGKASSSNPRPPVSKAEWPDESEWDDPDNIKQRDHFLDWAKKRFQEIIHDPSSEWDNGLTAVMGVLVRVQNSPWFHWSETDLDNFLAQHAPQDAGFTIRTHQRIKRSIQRAANGDVYLPQPSEEWMKEVVASLKADDKKREEHRKLSTEMLANIPEEFWKARPLFSKIRDAAHRRAISADTVFHAFLAGFCSQVPWNYRIVTGIGSGYVNFEHFVAVVGSSGSGKGNATKVGFELANAERSGTPSTGEGLIEFFLGNEPDWDNPANFEKDGVTPLKVPLYTKKVQDVYNGLFVFEEGSEIAQLASRQGATLYQILLKMAMGEELSTLNATESLKRKVEAGSYAVGLVAQFQIKVSGELIDQQESGLPQRFSWAATTDPSANRSIVFDPKVVSPGVVAPYRTDAPVDVTVSEDIIKDLRRRNLDIVTGKFEEDPMESHRPVKMLQLAGLLRLLEGPNTPNQTGYHITEEDWYLAGLLHETSRKVRDQLRARVAAGRDEEYQELGRREGKKLLARADQMEIDKIQSVRVQVLEKIDKLIKDGKKPAKIGYIKQMISAQRKPLVEQALQMHVDDGILTVTDDGVYARVSRH